MSTVVTFNERSPGSGSPTAPISPPPGSPHVHGKPSVVVVSSSTQTSLAYGAALTFSPKTCAELLPSLSQEQLSYEKDFFENLLGHNFDFKMRHPNIDAQTRAISMSLSSQITDELTNLTYDCNAYKELIFDLSCTVQRAQKYIEQLNTPVHRSPDDDPVEHIPHEPESDPVTTDFKFLDNEPVRYIENIKIDRNINDFVKDIVLEREGNRRVAYYGLVDYRYGRICHKARDYPDPDSEHIDYVFREVAGVLGDPEFNKSNYSCLFTMYDNHNANLNYHSDNEVNILPGSDIITVSLGNLDVLSSGIL